MSVKRPVYRMFYQKGKISNRKVREILLKIAYYKNIKYLHSVLTLIVCRI